MVGKVLLFLAFVGCASAALETCQKGGEYCLNHWDCCSNTCLSYLYKCSRIPAKSSGKVTSFYLSSQPFTESPLSLNDLIGNVFKPVENGNNAGRSRNTVSTRFTRQLPSDATSNVQTITSGPPACKSIGEKCYTNDECCSARCHGFLHQCVT